MAPGLPLVIRPQEERPLMATLVVLQVGGEVDGGRPPAPSLRSIR